MIYHLGLLKLPDLNVFTDTYCVLPPSVGYDLIHSSCQSLGADILLILPFTDKAKQTQSQVRGVGSGGSAHSLGLSLTVQGIEKFLTIQHWPTIRTLLSGVGNASLETSDLSCSKSGGHATPNT